MSAPDPAPLCEALNAAGCEYVVVGGLAVGVNGYPRATRDTDLVLAPGEPNWRCVLGALAAQGATHVDGRPLDPAVEPLRDHLRVESTYGPVDLLQEGEPPLSFAQLSEGAIAVELDGVQIPFAGLPELVGLKRLAGRAQDRADLEELEAARGPLPIVPLPGLDD